MIKVSFKASLPQCSFEHTHAPNALFQDVVLPEIRDTSIYSQIKYLLARPLKGLIPKGDFLYVLWVVLSLLIAPSVGELRRSNILHVTV